jgi:hypothetical protein
MIRLLLTLLFLPLCTLAACKERHAAPSFIDDQPGLLTAAERARIENYHRRLFEDLGIHLQVVILAERARDIDVAAASLFEAYRVGGERRGARGVLLLIDPQGGQARLEIGYDLEPVFTDLFVGRVERQQMVPFFQAGRVGAGVEGDGRAAGDTGDAGSGRGGDRRREGTAAPERRGRGEDAGGDRLRRSDQGAGRRPGAFCRRGDPAGNAADLP